MHVISPELGIALPGLTLVCPDSHTCTVGGLGALAWGIGTTEAEHALATGTPAGGTAQDPAGSLYRQAGPDSEVRRT